MTGPSGGSFDPVRAVFYKLVDAEETSGEPKPRQLSEFCKRHVRFMSRASREYQVQGQETSISTIVFRCRRDSKTETLTPEMVMEHRGRWYGLTGVNPIDYRMDEIEFVAQGVLKPGA